MSELYDIVVVGGGPAGLAAGIYGSRARLNTVTSRKVVLAAKRLPQKRWKTILVSLMAAQAQESPRKWLNMLNILALAL